MLFSRKFFSGIFYFIFFLFSYQLQASVFKCKRADGSVQFTDVVCANGLAEQIELHENSPLDSQSERENIEAYHHKQSQRKNISDNRSPQLVLIGDSRTDKRNARVTDQEIQADARQHRVKKAKKQRSRKKSL